MNRHLSKAISLGLFQLLILDSALGLAKSSARYALIIGNNKGYSNTLKLPTLKHAEHEAKNLSRVLISHGNFDSRRVILLTGVGRKDILRAVDRLAKIHRRDRKRLGDVSTLFAMFFTGHGLAGKLLTLDDPLDGRDLANIRRKINATLTVGFFDACYAGGLDFDTLTAKGAISTPGYNPVVEVPKEMLASKGLLWFVSSKPDELSYEDKKIGGLFTHYFIEAFNKAPHDEIGVSLENMWEFARSHTQKHAAHFGRMQTPEKVVQTLKSSGPLYFSYQQTRSAQLIFEKEVKGLFILTYEKGGLIETVDKKPGHILKAPIYDGKLLISKIETQRNTAFPTLRLDVHRRSSVRIRSKGFASSPTKFGFQDLPIRGKGGLSDLVFEKRVPNATLTLGAGYRFSFNSQPVLYLPHEATAKGWLAKGPLSIGVQLGYGTDSTSEGEWGYRLHGIDSQLMAGYGFGFGANRLDLEAAGGLSFFYMSYLSGNKRNLLGAWLGGAAVLSVPLPQRDPWIIFQAKTGMGARLSPGLVFSDDSIYLSAEPIFEVLALVPL